MTHFFIFYILLFFVCVKQKGLKAFTNPLFWLGFFWLLIIGVYFTSGIHYKYGMSLSLILFLFACIGGFLYYYKKGCHKNVAISNHINGIYTKKWVLIGLIGTLLFVLDYIRLNGFNLRKESSEISLIGSIGSLITPILLVVGLYLNAKSMKKNRTFNAFGIILMMLYGFPCIMNAGREAFLFVILGMLCLLGYKSYLNQGMKNTIPFKNKVAVFIISCIGFCGMVYVIFLVSMNRFTDNEISSLLAASDMDSNSMDEASSWGMFEFIYYNIASYFSHQIPFLDFTLREYHGPFFGGVFELNIISRRLPDFLELNYISAYEELQRLFSKCREDFSGGWNTVFGSLIIDFTWIGAVIVSCICGYYIGIAYKKFTISLDEKYAVLISLICLCSFSTIQLGPFYQTNLYGAFIWWYYLFKYKKSKI